MSNQPYAVRNVATSAGGASRTASLSASQPVDKVSTLPTQIQRSAAIASRVVGGAANPPSPPSPAPTGESKTAVGRSGGDSGGFAVDWKLGKIEKEIDAIKNS